VERSQADSAGKSDGSPPPCHAGERAHGQYRDKMIDAGERMRHSGYESVFIEFVHFPRRVIISMMSESIGSGSGKQAQHREKNQEIS
jgi:hypothetical protein